MRARARGVRSCALTLGMGGGAAGVGRRSPHLTPAQCGGCAGSRGGLFLAMTVGVLGVVGTREEGVGLMIPRHDLAW